MGQKVNPKIFRMGIVNTWDSKWFASKKNYSNFLKQDTKIKKFLKDALKGAAIDKIEIERSQGNIKIIIHSGKPGIVIGRSGAGVEKLKNDIEKKILNKMPEIKKVSLEISIQEVKNHSLSANIVLQYVIDDLEKRIPFRRAAKQAISKVEKAGALGVKIIVGGRLNGAEIARSEKFISGKIPLHTLRADIDYSRGAARTIYGAIGVKVWIYKGEVFKKV
ncbi:30S ribosomal protein S3 [Patescibacteria group bacterium]